MTRHTPSLIDRAKAALFALAGKAEPAAYPQSGAVVPLDVDTRWTIRQIAHNDPDPILLNNDPHMADQQPANFHYSRGFGLYEEMLDNDPRLLGMVKQRQLSVLEHCPGTLSSREPGNKRADELHAFGRGVLNGVAELDEAHAELWMGHYYGFTAEAPDWQMRDLRYFPGGSERVMRDCFRAVELHSRRRGRFLRTALGETRVKLHEGDVEGTPLHPKAILWHTPRQRYEGPYGVPLARVLWRYYFMKKHCLKFRIIDIERYGSPFVILTYEDATKKEKIDYRSLLSMIQQGVALLLPKGLGYQLANQIKGPTGSSPHESFVNLCNEEMAIAILGETLTASQGEKGTQALGTVHMSVLDKAVQSDANKIAAAIQILINWHVELNYGPEWVELSPVYKINTRKKNPAAWLALAETAQRMGHPVSQSQLTEETDLMPAEDDDDLLTPTQQGIAPLPMHPQAASHGASRFVTQLIPITQEAEMPNGSPAPQGAQPGGGATAANNAASQDNHDSTDVNPAVPATIRQLRDEGIAAQSAILAGLIDYVVGWANEQFDALGVGPEDDVTDSALRLPWDSLTLPEATRDSFVERLNNDHTTAQILAREAVLNAADAVALAFLRVYPRTQAGLDDDPPTNPLVEALYGRKRIVPREMLSVLNRKVRASVPDTVFYKFDALARSASTTAWDLCEADIRHIGGAAQDAGSWGYTRQQYANHLYDRLQARYLSDNGELHAWHIETIYDTNLATAYNQAQADAVHEMQDTFPFMQFVNPDPQAACCVERAGRVYSVSGPFMRASMPPLHFRCDSSIRPMTKAQVEREGLSVYTTMPQSPPEIYAGPKDSHGQPIGDPQPFGAWAPLDERYAHLEEEMRRVGGS